MLPRALALPLLLALAATASAQGYSPDEAVKRMKLPDGFSARCVAHEPMVRQPVSISFDTRGRMWVLQYLQYPNYAGLKALKQDQYLRTVWDKTPEPPPRGPKGADKITILFDPDEHGVFRKSKDFLTGLNIASGFCLVRGGVYVAQPPYLLFYADKDEDDAPDGDPEVLLSGFGMDDTHSLANSLQIGPDGWLYGAAGSTSTSKIKNLTHPADPVVEFQQGVWRFHPKTKKFELFSEGGGNPYGLDFDKNGQAIVGTNYGGFACLHQLQGAYYVKGFSKHGPLHNPHTYGYFEHVPYKNFKGGHVTCGGIVYQGDAYPKEFRDQYIAANLLSNAIYWHKLEPVKSSFVASHGGELIEANDPWFRPVDLLQGPDGCVYVVDFYDRRAAHLDPVDNWDKTNGRIYRIEYKGGPDYPRDLDLRKKTPAELLELLKHPNVWYRREARQLLAAMLDKPTAKTLWKWVSEGNTQLCLEAIWTLYTAGGDTERITYEAVGHSDPVIRTWGIRLKADHPEMLRDVGRLLAHAALSQERSSIVLAQLACSAKRVRPHEAGMTAIQLLSNPVVRDDPALQLLCWWALESAITRGSDTWFERFELRSEIDPALDLITERIARRLSAGDVKGWDGQLLEVMQMRSQRDPAPVLRGIVKGLEGGAMKAFPAKVMNTLRSIHKRQPQPSAELALEILARLNDETAIETFLVRVANAELPDAERLGAMNLMKQLRPTMAEAVFLREFENSTSDALRVGLLNVLEAYPDPKIGQTVLAAYPGSSAAVKKRSVQLLLSRPAWAVALFKALDAGTFPKTDVSVDQARVAVSLADKDLTALVEKHFGKVAPATAGEKQARISWLNAQIPREKAADAVRGKALFAKHCAACHVFHGEGGKVGPDLTTADRKNRGYMLAQIVDPSGYIRPEFVVQTVLTTDERKLSGVAKEVGETIELSNFVDNKVVTTVIPKKDVADVRPSAVSLMPEKLLDTLTDPEVADLFAYLASDALKNPGGDTPTLTDPEVADLFAYLASDALKNPGVDTPGSPGSGQAPGVNPGVAEQKKLKVALVSGSFEYKSDESLAGLKKLLEASYPIECVLISAKAEKDAALAGIEELAKCDAAIFFTRRLQIEGESLYAVKSFVKSGKPLLGLRTASHGFQKWLEMDKDVFGGDYKGHFGQGVSDVSVVEAQKDHPVLKGVAAFKTSGSLYKNPNVAADVTVLLRGSFGKESEPVAWVREKDGRRVVYTSLGHPGDFKDENFTRFVVNALAWATKTELKAAK
ncbi:l-sorbosone dehydrogenase : Putative membrane-bound dehydrogenase OS=Singulisphaera acidiphila (strain ATCC BAA-1392 / DSM 18658 / VKM B-2454 / MOB10) GN=Sinac_6954 PE=4 SV=1: Cytochrom_C: ThuA [Gemmataceae bacterium]|nr:l-sorbosone dehydrogenase : Putative membrane-bound dehydrogenase OS=Singulisphaera acidiphila (strain ATCC BAA-1392 / DSM 18658 / VKM B-2454 / MOB10) GN=Sinac_6954 PE=4 SV=1: Cytochrom_C: ThuA [Gemmataceae bacterium]VTT97126.1 l-sorbosone dehydrogenase : Putative membrane-bound dehydrogenase OS=Singulisphaera acidiphila (strain ATCC BAA-1392 / DSM 18658 / VKM B-2454 / MOB10) GN=Sinac_6954 PE=4 SV=1: Cytochrom_C: ThuA [Gemmataceae bacterium]